MLVFRVSEDEGLNYDSHLNTLFMSLLLAMSNI